MKSFDKTQDLRIALVHDYIKEYGGAERVLEALHEIWPTSPVFTSVYLPEFLGPHKDRFRDWDIKTSWLQYLPFKEKLISPFRLITPFVFKSFDLSRYDIVIVSATGAYSPNGLKIKNQKSKIKNILRSRISLRETNQNSKVGQRLKTNDQRPIHICYCHTPPRYLYGYATARDWKKNIVFRVLGEIANHFLRLVDFKSAQNVDYFIANSKNVAGRIKKFYRRDSTVIYPPVDVNSKFEIRPSTHTQDALSLSNGRNSKQYQNSKYKIQNSGYFLAGGRLARPKHIDLIVKACQELKVPLKVFGKGFAGYDKLAQSSKLKAQSSRIEFVGEVNDEEKLELMRNAKAYIFAAEDEDFGITPVEAMSVGTPVIAYKSGGVVESIIDGKTGLFFDELTVESLSKAIIRFNKDTPCTRSILVKQAQKFSKVRFKREVKEFVESRLR